MELKTILDKSSFHGLSAAELDVFRRYFLETIAPVLIFEVLGDLTSTVKRRKAPRDKVAELSAKLAWPMATVNANHRQLCLASLLGVRFPKSYAPVPDNYFQVPSGGMIVEESPLQDALRRWSQGHFTEAEVQISALRRQTIASLNLTEFMRRLSRELVLVPRADAESGITAVVDAMLGYASLQEPLLNWFLDHLAIDQGTRLTLINRWTSAGRPQLALHAPYVHHCARVLLALAVAVRHGFLKWQPTHVVDAQYLYYLPFCEIFVSDDHVHRLLAPQLLHESQTFLLHSELKATLKALVELEHNPGDRNAASAAYARLDVLWTKHRARAAPRYAESDAV